MKYFFGTNITDKTKEPVMDGVAFISRRVPGSQQRALDDHREKLGALEKKAKLPFVFQAIKVVAMFAAMITFVSILRTKVTLSEAYGNAPWVFWSGAIGAVVWAVLALVDYLLGKRVRGTEAYQYTVKQMEQIRKNAFALLGIPNTAVPVDVLQMDYKVKNGKEKRVAGMADYLNPEYWVFGDEDALYLSDGEVLYTVPLEAVTGICAVNKQVRIAGWNKPVAYNKGMFKGYNLTANKYGHVFIKPYYQLRIRRGTEEYALEFPPYELPTFQKLTGKPVSDM